MGRRWRCFQLLTSVVFLSLCVAVYFSLEPPDTGMQVEEATLPTRWVSREQVTSRLAHRRHHLNQVCKKYGLENVSADNIIHSRVFLINHQYKLVWCPVFKAASSTWLWNFNLLAGYTQEELLAHIHQPLPMARKRYPKPSHTKLKMALEASPQPLTFMIARHPLLRLVSAFRDKMLSGKKNYRQIIQLMKQRHPELGIRDQSSWLNLLPDFLGVPTFSQFVQHILDQHANHQRLNEHWVPASQFCTPCLVNYTVLAKVETLDEDANHIIFSSGVQEMLSPRTINRSQDGSTALLADHYLCQLSHIQMTQLLQLYKYDIELFEYDVQKYIDCTKQ
ncbi:carbohydrate sulfotransferase 9-like [Panulirus ornatus]|uniref:carbohydrate sulfotransferase 9-like n=1 Tax=Panulirus ornatus TaxID=150431 RepID=UPI003A889A31